MRFTSPAGHVVNVLVMLASYAVTPGAALVFYGPSLLVASACGVAGCELLAISNVLQRRDDETGCAVLWPVMPSSPS